MFKRAAILLLLATMFPFPAAFTFTHAATANSDGLDYPSAWRCDATKFNWYCELEDPEDKPAPPRQKTKAEAALDNLKVWRKEIEEKRALSIMEPTPENVKSYIVAQEKLLSNASLYSDVWRRVIWQNPDVNYELKRPYNNAAISTYTKERTQVTNKTMADLNKEWGIFFFFRSDCPYCHRMSSTMRFIQEHYGVTVLAISLDGGTLPDFPNAKMDNGMAETPGVTQVPAYVLGNVKQKKMVPIGTGMVSADDMVDRIYVLTKTKPGDLY